MKVTNRLNLPEGFVKAVETERHNKPGCLSATTLLKGTKEIVLTERHWEEIEEDAADRVWATFGTAAHSILERSAKKGDLVEQTLSVEVGGVTVTGRIDRYDIETGEVTDWKTASVWKVLKGDFDDWYGQGVLYAWLLSKNGFPANRVRFVALLKDHSRSKARTDRGYPQSPVHVWEHEVTRMDLELAAQMAEAKVRDYKANLGRGDDEIPPCEPFERWTQGEAWAVMRRGRKSALRVFPNEALAEEFLSVQGADCFVEHRPGVDRKCLDYCPVRGFCSHGRSAQEASE